MSRAERALAAALAGLLLACSHVASPARQVAPAALPVGEAHPFAALYRLDCCRQGNLLATIRGDGERLSVAVAAGPAGTVVEAWLETGDGWLRNGGDPCVRPLPPGVLPLAGGATVPLDPALAASLLAGTVPPEARPSPRDGGWLEAEVRDLTVSWLVADGVVTTLEASRGGASAPSLVVTLSGHHGRVPGRLAFRAGGQSGELVLVEWRSAPMPARPAWVSAPPCGERS
jgi:hypothetical protein